MAIPKEFTEAWRRIIIKAWNDEKFKKKLLSHPKEVLEEYGIQIPHGVSVEIVEANSSKQKDLRFTLPAKPSLKELENEVLSQAVGGWSCGGGMDKPREGR